MSQRLYRIDTRTGPVPIDIENTLVADRPCDAPPDPLCPKVEWSCTNSACPEREVVTTANYLNQPAPQGPPPVKLCPTCHQPLCFVTFLKEVLLTPAGI